MKKVAQKKRLLLTGASGFLGWNICRQAPKKWKIYGVVHRHPLTIPGINILSSDLRNFKELKKLFNNLHPETVMHTAAISDPNFCQLNKEETQAINLEAALNLAGLCADYKIPLVFTSTDLVFDGLHPPTILPVRSISMENRRPWPRKG